MTQLYYQGHGSYRFRTNDGRIVYFDPYVGDGYDLPADLILVTHGHDDHNQVHLVTKKQNCRTITHKEALSGGKHNKFDVHGIIIEAVEASNVNHDPKQCVGYILTIDGIKIYCSGDTSKTKQMSEFASRELDYAIFCGDGVYNMDLKEAAECAKAVNAKHNIIVHIKPGSLFDRKRAEKWDAPNKLIIEPGEEITL